jgi:hypothetical protein
MNYDAPDVDPVENWLEIRRGFAVQRVEDARAAVRQVAATVSHNATAEWIAELEQCKNALAAAEQTLAEFDAEHNRGTRPKA